MSKQRHASVWDAIEDTPAEVENMKLRSELMMALKKLWGAGTPWREFRLGILVQLKLCSGHC